MKFKVGDRAKIVNPKQEGDFKYKNDIVTIKHANEFFRIYCVEENDRPWGEDELAKVEFTLNDLQFADILTLRNGERYVYADGYIYGEEECYGSDADNVREYYNDDLTYEDRDYIKYDIMKVERTGQVVFERDETIKEMTLEEVCKELGYDVKIIKE